MFGRCRLSSFTPQARSRLPSVRKTSAIRFSTSPLSMARSARSAWSAQSAQSARTAWGRNYFRQRSSSSRARFLLGGLGLVMLATVSPKDDDSGSGLGEKREGEGGEKEPHWLKDMKAEFFPIPPPPEIIKDDEYYRQHYGVMMDYLPKSALETMEDIKTWYKGLPEWWEGFLSAKDMPLLPPITPQKDEDDNDITITPKITLVMDVESTMLREGTEEVRLGYRQYWDTLMEAIIFNGIEFVLYWDNFQSEDFDFLLQYAMMTDELPVMNVLSKDLASVRNGEFVLDLTRLNRPMHRVLYVGPDPSVVYPKENVLLIPASEGPDDAVLLGVKKLMEVSIDKGDMIPRVWLFNEGMISEALSPFLELPMVLALQHGDITKKQFQQHLAARTELLAEAHRQQLMLLQRPKSNYVSEDEDDGEPIKGPQETQTEFDFHFDDDDDIPSRKYYDDDDDY